MDIKTVKLSDVSFAKENTRMHAPNQIYEIKRSLKMFGQYRPVIVDENNVIICGNGLVRAMMEDGYDTVEVMQYTNLSEKQKKKLMLADNQISTLGVDDFEMIEKFINDLSDDLDIPGFNEDSLKDLVLDIDGVDDAIMSYGSYSQEQLEVVKKRADKEQVPVEQTYKTTDNRQILNNMESEEQVSSVETYKYIICPHCGEKVYLE